MSTDLQKFIDVLDRLEPSAEQLRRDPRGTQWLPDHIRSVIESNEEFREVFVRYVECELALYEGSSVPADVFFTTMVMAKLPANSKSPMRQRFWILSLSYSLALGYAANMFFTVREEFVMDSNWLHHIADFGAAWESQLLIVVGVIAVFLPLSLAISLRRMVSSSG